jgi:hypothetical protein
MNKAIAGLIPTIVATNCDAIVRRVDLTSWPT